jgi:hypothetical protein
MEVLDPSGKPVAAGAYTEVAELNCGRFVTLNSPAAGEYRVRVTGWGRFWTLAQGESEIFLTSVRFVEQGGRPGHEGLFPIAGQPLAGRPATLAVTLSGPVKDTGFRLVSPGGEALKSVKMRTISETPEDHQFLGTLDLPSVPFRIAVSGTDEKTHPFQRFFSGLFHAETVAVLPHASMLDEVPPGKTTALTYAVLNVGPPATFRILVADSHGFVSRVEPKEITLATGTSGMIHVHVAVPAGTRPGTGFDVTVTATSLTGPATSNGISQHLAVFPAGSP